MKDSDNSKDQQVKTLRAKLRKTLDRFIQNKDISEKEMSIFEKTVSRRDFLSGTAKVSAVAALVGQGLAPSAWAARRPELSLPSQEMPVLTAEMKASIITASKIGVTSDVVDGMLQHKHIEHVDSSDLEACLEGLNAIPMAQETFNATAAEAAGLNPITKTYGHPEIITLNTKEQVLKVNEVTATGSAGLKEKEIDLPNIPNNLILDGKDNRTLSRGEKWRSQFLHLEFRANGVLALVWKKTGQILWQKNDPSITGHAKKVIFNNKGNLVISDGSGNSLYNSGNRNLKNPKLVLDSRGWMTVYDKPEWLDLQSANYVWRTNRSSKQGFVADLLSPTFTKSSQTYNRVVAVNGQYHNTVRDGMVHNQKMILVAKQSVEGSWKDLPSWVEHVSDCNVPQYYARQMTLYTQSTRHALHMPEANQLQSGPFHFDDGMVPDTSGEQWHVWRPLQLLYDNLTKLDYDLKLQGNTSLNGTVHCTIEDIDSYEDGNGFKCLYGTIKLNYWCNIGFYITLPDAYGDDVKPIVKFFSLYQKDRGDYLKAVLEKANCPQLFDDIRYSEHVELPDEMLKTNYRIPFTDPDFFANQIFRPACLADNNGRDKLIFTYKAKFIEYSKDSTNKQVLAAIDLDSQFDENSCIYSADSKVANTISCDGYTNGEENMSHIEGTFSLSTNLQGLLPNPLVDSSNNKKLLFYCEHDAAAMGRLKFVQNRVEILFNSDCICSAKSENHTDFKEHYFKDQFTNLPLNIDVAHGDIKKITYSRGHSGAIRVIHHHKDGSLKIFRQKVDRDNNQYGEPVVDDQYGLPVFMPEVVTVSQTIERLLHWNNYFNDAEFICVENIGGDKAKKQYAYYVQEALEQTWHNFPLHLQVSEGETQVQTYLEKATVYDVELQAKNIYDKPVPLAKDECFEVRFAQPTYMENFTSGPQRGVGVYAGRLGSLFVTPDASGRALLQVKCPHVDQISGLTFYYRIIKRNHFERAVATPLLRLKNDVNELYAWNEINLAYQVHNRLEQETDSKDGKVCQEVFKNINEDYNHDEAKGKIQEGLKQYASKIAEANKQQKANLLSTPVLMYRNDNPIAVVNPLLKTTHGLQGKRLGGFFSWLWHAICDAALAILNKIKEAVQWVQKQLDNILKELENLGIPGISDIAKLARGIVSFIGSVVTLVIDIAIVIVNVLRYIFDFDVAYEVGKSLTGFVKELLGAVSLKKASSQLQSQQMLFQDVDLNEEINKITSEDIQAANKDYNDVAKDTGDFDEPENINYVKNTLSKHVDENVEVQQQLQSAFSNSLTGQDTNLKNLDLTLSDSANNNFDKIAEIFGALDITNPKSFDLVGLFNNLKTLDLNSVLSDATESLKKIIEDIVLAPASLLSKFLEAMEKIKIPSFVSYAITNILDVKFESFLDIFYLILGYPVMIGGVLVNETIKLFGGEGFGDIKEIIAKASDCLPGHKKDTSYSQNQLTYIDGKWHKDALQIFKLAMGGVGAIFKCLRYTLKDPDKPSSIDYPVAMSFKIIQTIPMLVDAVTIYAKQSIKGLNYLGLDIEPKDIKGLDFMYNSFSQIAEASVQGNANLAAIRGVLDLVFNDLVLQLYMWTPRPDKTLFKNMAKVLTSSAKVVALFADIVIICRLKPGDKQEHQLKLAMAKSVIGGVTSIVDIINYFEFDNKNPYLIVGGCAGSVINAFIGLAQGVLDEDK